jgi:hypothetical protein
MPRLLVAVQAKPTGTILPEAIRLLGPALLSAPSCRGGTLRKQARCSCRRSADAARSVRSKKAFVEEGEAS